MAYRDEEGNEIELEDMEVETVVDGEVQSLSIANLIAKVQKADAADKRLQEAVELKKALEAERKDNQNKLKLADDYAAAFSGDRDALRRVAKASYGIQDDSELDNLLADLESKMGGQRPQPQPQASDPVIAKLAAALKQRNLDPEQFIAGVSASLGAQGDDLLAKTILSEASKLPVLKKVLKSEDAKMEFLNAVKRDVRGRRDANGKLSTDTISVSVRETARLLEKSGIGDDSQAGVSVGGAPDVDPALAGYLKTGKKLVRPSSTSGEAYEQYIATRALQRLQELSGESATI